MATDGHSVATTLRAELSSFEEQHYDDAGAGVSVKLAFQGGGEDIWSKSLPNDASLQVIHKAWLKTGGELFPKDLKDRINEFGDLIERVGSTLAKLGIDGDETVSKSRKLLRRGQATMMEGQITALANQYSGDKAKLKPCIRTKDKEVKTKCQPDNFQLVTMLHPAVNRILELALKLRPLD